MKLTKKILVVFISFGLIFLGVNVSAKQIFKDGSVIKILVPFSPGGGYDRACRLIAPFYEKELEKIAGINLTAIIVNVTGAGGVKGYSRMFRAKPDGKTIGMLGLAAAPYQQLATGMFDLNEFNFIAVVNTDPNVIVVKNDMPVNSFEELIKRSQQKTILMSTSGKGASEHIESLITKALLEKSGKKLSLDFVHYRGSAPAALAIIKGEAEALMTTESSSYNHVKNGDLKSIVIFSKSRGKLQPDVPTVFEQKIPSAGEMYDVLGMIRTIVAPPKINKNTIRVMQKAMLNSLNNPKLIEKANKMKLPISPNTGDKAKESALKRLKNAKKYQEMIMSTFK
jgi:tripartite-type tricarboxylate transporter receptor subunit TctC